MVNTVSYAAPLRAIGQALQGLRVDSFEVKTQGEEFVVQRKAKTPQAGKSLGREPRTKDPWRWLAKLRGGASGNGPNELRYSRQDIYRLETEGIAKRQNPRGMPDAHSLSQLLRAIGGYLELRGASLVSISKQDQLWAIGYKTFDGRPEMERLTTAGVYQLSIRMYMHRSGRRES